MSEKITTFVQWLWAVIGVLVLLGGAAFGVKLNHDQRVIALRKDYDLKVFGVTDFEVKVRQYKEEEIAWKRLLDVGGEPGKKLRHDHNSNKKLYHDITDKKFSGKSLLEHAEEEKERAFSAWSGAKNRWW